MSLRRVNSCGLEINDYKYTVSLQHQEPPARNAKGRLKKLPLHLAHKISENEALRQEHLAHVEELHEALEFERLSSHGLQQQLEEKEKEIQRLRKHLYIAHVQLDEYLDECTCGAHTRWHKKNQALEVGKANDEEAPTTSPSELIELFDEASEQLQQVKPDPAVCQGCGQPIKEGDDYHDDIDDEGSRIHATKECEIAFENRTAEKCAHCGEALLPGELETQGKFSGEVVVFASGNKYHVECKEHGV
jgi:hypothetical protein